MLGDEVRVHLYLRASQFQDARYISGADVLIGWDPTILELTWDDEAGGDVFDENVADYDFMYSDFLEDSALDKVNNDLDPVAYDPNPFTTAQACTNDAQCTAFGTTCAILSCQDDYQCKNNWRGWSFCDEEFVCGESPMPATHCSEGNPEHFDDCCTDEMWNCCQLEGLKSIHSTGVSTYTQINRPCYTCECDVNYCDFMDLPYNDGLALLHLLTVPGSGQVHSGESDYTEVLNALEVPASGQPKHLVGSFVFKAIGPGTSTVEIVAGGEDMFPTPTSVPPGDGWGTKTDVIGLQYPYTGVDILGEIGGPVGIQVTACEPPLVDSTGPGPRYIRITPQGNPAVPVALKITGLSEDVDCMSGYVQGPGGTGDWRDQVRLVGSAPYFATPDEWGEVWVSGDWILPSREYQVEADCNEAAAGTFMVEANYGMCEGEEPCTSKLMALDGDIAGNATYEPGMPNNVVNLTDVLLVLDLFSPVPSGLEDMVADITREGRASANCTPNQAVNLSDILVLLDCFGPGSEIRPDPCLDSYIEGFCGD